MPGICSVPNDGTALLRLIRDPGDPVEDCELVLRETHHRMKNTLMRLGRWRAASWPELGQQRRRLQSTGSNAASSPSAVLYQLSSDDNQGSVVSFDVIRGAMRSPLGCHPGARRDPLRGRDRLRFNAGVALQPPRFNPDGSGDKRGQTCLPGQGGRVRIGLTYRDRAWFCTVTDNGIGSNGSLPGSGARILDGLCAEHLRPDRRGGRTGRDVCDDRSAKFVKSHGHPQFGSLQR
jgi:hypothetical protein